jgi:CRISPR/Cas system-associated endonuclease Cas1
MVGATQAKAVEDAAAKADVTKAMLLRKIYRLQEFLQRVKRGPFTV